MVVNFQAENRWSVNITLKDCASCLLEELVFILFVLKQRNNLAASDAEKLLALHAMNFKNVIFRNTVIIDF